MTPDGSRSVALTVPAHADYLVLARLALSAVCRLTEMRPEDVSDLKLAITEAAGTMVGDPSEPLRFSFDLGDEAISVSIAGKADGAEPEDDLARAIVAATVDEYTYADERVDLVKYLRPQAG